MRSVLLLLMSLALAACAPASPAVRATMPLQIWRAEGEAPRMGEIRLEAGGFGAGSPFALTIAFDGDGTTLGKVQSVTWQMSLEGYCRDDFSVVRSVLIDPSGRVWRVGTVFVPAGPDRRQNWSSGGFVRGNGGPDTQSLFDAVEAGGQFTLAVEDDDGELWLPVVIDTLTRSQRRRLLSANRAAFAATDPETVPVSSERPLVMVTREPYQLPSPPRRCPQSDESVATGG